MEKEIVKINQYVELHVKITPEMRKDFAECEAKAMINGGDGKDCDTCSLYGTDCLGVDMCEIPAIAKLL